MPVKKSLILFFAITASISVIAFFLYPENPTQLQEQKFSRILIFVLLISVIVSSAIMLFTRYFNKKKQDFEKAAALTIADLQRRNEELKKALSELKATQQQLIQKEKMASLGELTVGIAHEIQNPLNFVNNFSEMNGELMNELKSELLSLTIPSNKKEHIESLVEDLIEYNKKVTQHGQRAQAILKSMLEHSRQSSGKKEIIDINMLTEEYLDLSYRNQKSRNKELNVKIERDYDAAAGKVDVVPQDMGRVLLNLFSNAFSAVAEKKIKFDGSYEPKIKVSTKRADNHVIISVRDNGIGIPEKLHAKIYQPFFTTKPTGQGTGLGLSLSYDIVTKGHGGEMKVVSKEGEGAEFILKLPISSGIL